MYFSNQMLLNSFSMQCHQASPLTS